MKTRFMIKLLVGLTIVVLLVLLCVKMIDLIADAAVNLITGGNISEIDEQIMFTPEPMPTMPAYIGEESFYDTAGSVVFDDE